MPKFLLVVLTALTISQITLAEDNSESGGQQIPPVQVMSQWNKMSLETKIGYLISERIFWTRLLQSLAFVRENRKEGLFIGIPVDLLAVLQLSTSKAALWEVRAGEKGVTKLGEEMAGAVEKMSDGIAVRGSEKLLGTVVSGAEVPVNGALRVSFFNSKLALAGATPFVGVSTWYYLKASAFDRWISKSQGAIDQLSLQIAADQLRLPKSQAQQ